MADAALSCIDVEKFKLPKVYLEWGKTFVIEFDIRINEWHGDNVKMLNAFKFTATDSDDDDMQSDNLPSLKIYKEGYIEILNTDSKYSTKFDFELEKVHHVMIKQFKKDSKYWYEIVIDDQTKVDEENTNVYSYSTVSLYVNREVDDSFTSDYGYICNLIVGK